MELITKDNYFILKLAGEIVFENSNEKKNKIKDLFNKNNVKNVIIDIGKVPFLDSSGVGVLISLFKYIREKEGKMAIAVPTKKVQRVIEITNLFKIMDIYTEIEQAIARMENE